MNETNKMAKFFKCRTKKIVKISINNDVSKNVINNDYNNNNNKNNNNKNNNIIIVTKTKTIFGDPLIATLCCKNDENFGINGSRQKNNL